MLNGPRYIMGGLGSSLAPLQELVLSNNIKPPIDRRLPFDEAAVRECIAYLASHRARQSGYRHYDGVTQAPEKNRADR